jgi:anti-sigma factor (TIGR02949 family)
MTDEPRDIDCMEVLDRLYEYIDGELTPARAAEVQRHLDACGPCFRLSGFESAYVRFLEARTRAQHAPAELRKKILEQLLLEGSSSDSP